MMRGLPPRMTATSKPYWDGLGRGEVVLQHCTACDRKVFYPRPFCPHCTSPSLDWRAVDGRASLYTFTIAEVPVSAAFAHLDRPILAVAEIEGVHIPTTLVDTDIDQVSIGMALDPVFDAATYPGLTLLRFKPAADGRA